MSNFNNRTDRKGAKIFQLPVNFSVEICSTFSHNNYMLHLRNYVFIFIIFSSFSFSPLLAAGIGGQFPSFEIGVTERGFGMSGGLIFESNVGKPQKVFDSITILEAGAKYKYMFAKPYQSGIFFGFHEIFSLGVIRNDIIRFWLGPDLYFKYDTGCTSKNYSDSYFGLNAGGGLATGINFLIGNNFAISIGVCLDMGVNYKDITEPDFGKFFLLAQTVPDIALSCNFSRHSRSSSFEFIPKIYIAFIGRWDEDKKP